MPRLHGIQPPPPRRWKESKLSRWRPGDDTPGCDCTSVRWETSRSGAPEKLLGWEAGSKFHFFVGTSCIYSRSPSFKTESSESHKLCKLHQITNKSISKINLSISNVEAELTIQAHASGPGPGAPCNCQYPLNLLEPCRPQASDIHNYIVNHPIP